MADEVVFTQQDDGLGIHFPGRITRVDNVEPADEENFHALVSLHTGRRYLVNFAKCHAVRVK